MKVLDLDPCERSVTRRATLPKGRKGRRPGRRERCESPEAQRFGGIADTIPPAQILHHPEKQVAVADPGRNHHAKSARGRSRDEDGQSISAGGLRGPPVSAYVGREEKEWRGQRVDARRPDLDCEGP